MLLHLDVLKKFMLTLLVLELMKVLEFAWGGNIVY